MSDGDGIIIKPLEGESATLIAAINNASMPEDTWVTEEQIRIWEGLQDPNEPPLRLVAWDGEQAVALGSVGRNIFSSRGRYSIGIQVLPDHRRRGIATRLYEQLAPVAQERGAVALRTDIHQHCLPLSESWLDREGYREVERMRPSELDIEHLDVSDWKHAFDRLSDQGITMTTLADEDSPENRYKIWELSEVAREDIPHHGPSDPFPFEMFDELLNKPEARPGCLVIAKEDDRYVGFTLLVHQTPEKALTGLTGVLREYRGRGIALALKIRCADLARDAGYKRMRTFNHVNNPAMLAVNDRLGYIALPHEILYEKELDPGLSAAPTA